MDEPGAHWSTFAECRGLDTRLFFPELGDDTRAAKAVCAVCPVRAECLADALEQDDHHGIWGGTSERERRNIRRNRSKTLTIMIPPLRQDRNAI